jgi:type II secretory pathway pseudopilin PulG
MISKPFNHRGLTLVEALVALLVLSFGLLAVARLQPLLRQHAEAARQRSEALRIAQADIERVRTFATLAAYETIGGSEQTVEPEGTPTRYHLARQIERDTAAHALALTVTVDWPDRAGALQQVRLASVVAGIDPALSGALGLAPRGVAVKGAAARSVDIPLAAKDLGDGRSVFKPAAGGIAAILFDNRSGSVIATCTGIAAGTGTQSITTSDLSACTRLDGMLVRGEIRFSSATPPDATNANDTPLPTTVTLALEGPTPPVAPWCNAEAMKTVAFTWAGSQRIDAVPLAATPASLGLESWTERGERFVAYHCVVVPPAGITRWSGRTTLVPTGWAIGTAPEAWRICRFSSDADHSGAIDANIEHPAIYQNVTGALARQNFLVVRGDQTCPAATDTPTSIRLATVQHQP